MSIYTRAFGISRFNWSRMCLFSSALTCRIGLAGWPIIKTPAGTFIPAGQTARPSPMANGSSSALSAAPDQIEAFESMVTRPINRAEIDESTGGNRRAVILK